MRLKIDFVTNSSSSSFIIQKINLTPLQIMLIKEHITAAKMIADYRGEGDYVCEEWWSIEESDEAISGYTPMDNFSMSTFLEDIGVADEHIEWSDY